LCEVRWMISTTLQFTRKCFAITVKWAGNFHAKGTNQLSQETVP
jgi:hypothetical protein